MKKNLLSKISKKAKNEFFEALYYMNMHEIKVFCAKHKIPIVGKKGIIITRICHYLQTGEIIQPKSIPSASIAKKGTNIHLEPSALILKGSYRNDLKTRNFFKKLIGGHFHFTAFGQDWINDRWLKGKPPTYQEFSTMWQKEYLQRKSQKAMPKQEWAYLNFIQRYLAKHPSATRNKIVEEWEKERLKQVKKARNILDKIEL